jgi:hypothetical protein
MRSDCEAVVVRAELQGALEATGSALTLMPPDIVRISPWRGGLRFTTAHVTADFSAAGRWNRIVEAPLAAVAGIIAKSVGVTLALLYSGNKLILGRTMIDAREEPATERLFQPGADRQPQLIEARADFARLMGRPLRPRRPQEAVSALPLFGGTSNGA